MSQDSIAMKYRILEQPDGPGYTLFYPQYRFWWCPIWFKYSEDYLGLGMDVFFRTKEAAQNYICEDIATEQKELELRRYNKAGTKTHKFHESDCGQTKV